jgi:hypothetical protein
LIKKLLRDISLNQSIKISNIRYCIDREWMQPQSSDLRALQRYDGRLASIAERATTDRYADRDEAFGKTISSIKQISNLTSDRLEFFKFLPDTCRSYYLLA